LENYDVDRYLNNSLEYFRNTNYNNEFAKAKYLHGWVLSMRSDLSNAKEALIEAYAGFLRCDEIEWQGRALNRLAFVSHHFGDDQGAVDYIKKAISAYEKSGNTRAELFVSTDTSG
jgi:hypothetical protein